MNKASIIATGLALFLAGVSVAQAQTALDKLVAAAKGESELSFTAGGDTFGGSDVIPILESAFNKRFGLSAKLHFTAGASMPAMAARVAQEVKAGAKGSTDTYLGSLSHFVFLEKEGALKEIHWSEVFPWITPEMTITKNLGVLIRTGVDVIVYNSNVVKVADAPRSYDDLVDATRSKAWAGQMAMPVFPDFLLALSMIWPKDRVVDFARKLAAASTGIIRYGELQRLVNGEFAVMANEVTGLEGKAFWNAKGAKLEAVIPTDPAVAAFFQVGVPKNSSSPNLATLFLGYLASPEGQAITDQYGFQGSHLVPTTSVAKLIAANNVKLIDPLRVKAYYEKGPDPELSGLVSQLLKR